MEIKKTLRNFFKKREVKIFLTIWLIYIFFISNYGGNDLADSVIAGSMAILDRGDFIIDNYIKGGCIIHGCDNAFYNGHFYSGGAPGGSILGLPIYALFKITVFPLINLILGFQLSNIFKIIILNIFYTIFISSALSAGLSIILYKTLKYYIKNIKYRLLLTLLFAFGTIFFIYSTGYYVRVISVFFLFLSFYLLFKCKKEKIKKNYLFFAGLSAASAIAIEYTAGIMFVLLSLYLLSFLRDKRVIYYILGAIIPIILLLSYHQLLFGNPIKTPYDYRANPKVELLIGNNFLKIEKFNIENTWVYLLSPEKGLFFFMPFLIFSLIGIIYGIKNKKYQIENILILSILLGYTSYLSVMGKSWVGSFGPSYLLPVIPFLIIPITLIIKKFVKPLLILGGISFLINFLGVLYDRTGLWAGAYSLKNPITTFYIPTFFQRGITNYTLNLIKYKLYDVPVYLMNIIALSGLIILGVIIYFIWKYN